MKRVILMLCVMLLLTACSRDVNEHIRQQYHIGGQGTEETDVTEENVIDKYDEQDSKAKSNANRVYDALYDTNIKQYNSFFDIAVEDDTPAAKRVLLVTYALYVRIKYLAPYIGVVSVSVGGIVFLLSKYNKGLRRFALYGLIIGVPCILIFIIFGYGILADMFMY